MLTDRFPEIRDGARALPDGTVLDGEILAWEGDGPRPFAALQQRIGRERQLARAMRDVPVAFVAYDLLEHAGRDCRSEALTDRRRALELVSDHEVRKISVVGTADEVVTRAREFHAAGIRLPILVAVAAGHGDDVGPFATVAGVGRLLTGSPA